MNTVNYTINEQTTFLSDDFVQLSKDKLELDRKNESDDPELMSALYEALAEKFEADKHFILAGACQKAADRWRQ